MIYRLSAFLRSGADTVINVGIVIENHFPRLGGMEFTNHFLAEHLNKCDNVQAAVACATMREIPLNYVYPYPCYRANSFSYLTPFLFKRNQEQMIREQKVNVLHGPMLHGGGYYAMRLGQKHGIPFVTRSHGSDVQIVPEINYGAMLTSEAKKIVEVVHRVDHIIAVSNINMNDLIELGARKEKITVVHNGIKFKEIQRVPFEDLRALWKIEPEDFVLISVGRNRPVKRMELLFSALKRLRDWKKIKCVCVGPRENLGALAQQYDILNNVILAGRLPKENNFSDTPPFVDLVNAYRAADLYVSTSYVESFNNSAAEALACGIPILVGKKQGVRDIIKEKRTGWMMERETPQELADLIVHLYEQKETLQQDSSMIRDSVSWLTWDYAVKKMVSIYKNLL